MTPQSSDPILRTAHVGLPPRSEWQDAIGRPVIESPAGSIGGSVGGAPGVDRARIVETGQLYPGYVTPLAALTVVFLAIELAFVSRLLDAIGNPINGRQLTEISSWGWALSGKADTLVSLVFRAKGQQTEITLTHSGLPTEDDRVGHGKGWNSTLNKLARFVKGEPV